VPKAYKFFYILNFDSTPYFVVVGKKVMFHGLPEYDLTAQNNIVYSRLFIPHDKILTYIW